MADIEGLKIELKKTLHRMMLEDTRIWLIKTLLRMKLATWDIFNFAVKQAGLRTTLKSLDWQTMKSALRAKLSDARLTLNKEKRKKSKIEQSIKRDFSSEKNILKQLMMLWKRLIRKE